jgi:hypothetical protein
MNDCQLEQGREEQMVEMKMTFEMNLRATPLLEIERGNTQRNWYSENGTIYCRDLVGNICRMWFLSNQLNISDQ